ncbi:MAG: hypothetical protein J6V80_04450, partial [Clostridia bacterium]|nr:hypothetical protein [Clostridia bacterium]
MKSTKIRLLVCLVIATLVFSVMAIGSFAAVTLEEQAVFEGYATLSEALEAAKNVNTGTAIINLGEGTIDEDVIIQQKPGLNLVIVGNNTTFDGQIEIDGQPDGLYGTGTLTIKNINFASAEVADGSYIFAPKKNASNQMCYPHNVTVEGCTFTNLGESNSVVAIKLSSDVANISVIDCTVNAGMHSLLQLPTGSKGNLTVSGCDVNATEGINLNSSVGDITITDNTFNVVGYAVRVGQSGNGTDAPELALTGNTIHSKDAAIVIRGSATKASLSMEKNAVTTENNAPHINVTVADASDVTVAAEKNYWGENITVPVTSGIKVNVWESYSDADFTELVAGGNAVAFVGDDHFFSLADAIASLEGKTGDFTITLAEGTIKEDIVIVRNPEVNLTIVGNNTIFNGTITVDGNSATYATGSLTIKNLNFDATDISKDYCINFGVSNKNDTSYRYITNVTIEG